MERVRGSVVHPPSRRRFPGGLRHLQPGRRRQGAGGPRARVQDPRLPPAHQRTHQDQAAAHLPGGVHVRRLRRRVVRPPNGIDAGSPGALGKLLDRAQQGGAQSQQGDDGIRRLDRRAVHLLRRNPAPGRRHQVAGLPAQPTPDLEPRRVHGLAVQRRELLLLPSGGRRPPRLGTDGLRQRR